MERKDSEESIYISHHLGESWVARCHILDQHAAVGKAELETVCTKSVCIWCYRSCSPVFGVWSMQKKYFLNTSRSPQNLMHSLIFSTCWAGLLLNLPRMLLETFSLAHIKQDEQTVSYGYVWFDGSRCSQRWQSQFPIGRGWINEQQ